MSILGKRYYNIDNPVKITGLQSGIIGVYEGIASVKTIQSVAICDDDIALSSASVTSVISIV